MPRDPPGTQAPASQASSSSDRHPKTHFGFQTKARVAFVATRIFTFTGIYNDPGYPKPIINMVFNYLGPTKSPRVGHYTSTLKAVESVDLQKFQ